MLLRAYAREAWTRGARAVKIQKKRHIGVDIGVGSSKPHAEGMYATSGSDTPRWKALLP